MGKFLVFIQFRPLRQGHQEMPFSVCKVSHVHLTL